MQQGSDSGGNSPQLDPALDHEPGRGTGPEPIKFHVEEILAATIMAMLCLITIANVLTRYFTDISFAFTEEISVFLIAALTFIGTATAFARKRHLAIMFIVLKFSARAQRRFEIFGIVCGIATFAVLAWYGYFTWLDDYETGLTSPGLGMPQWIYTAMIPVLSALVVYRLVCLLLDARRAPPDAVKDGQ